MHKPEDRSGSHPWQTVEAMSQLYVCVCECVCILGIARARKEARLVQIVILSDELLELGLNVYDALRRKFKFDDGHASFPQVLQESDFRRLEKHQTATAPVCASSRSTDAMDVVSWVIRWIELDDPIHIGNLVRAHEPHREW